MSRCYYAYASPVGTLLLAAEDDCLVGLRIEKDARAAEFSPPSGVLSDTCLWLEAYFAGKAPSADALPLLLRGTSFQCRVWRELRRIPYGVIVSYGALARRLSTSARAVGGAVARNPLLIVLPCHRVVGAGGKLGGYAGGAERKRLLLAAEGVLPN